jgi:hypothetical protein
VEINVMKYLFATFIIGFIGLLNTSCGSKKTAGKENIAEKKITTDVAGKKDMVENREVTEEEKSIAGIYRFAGRNKIHAQAQSTIELKSDGTATSDFIAGGKYKMHSEGRFTFRNDSIFITWDYGKKIKSGFSKTSKFYYFNISGNSYIRKP